MNFAVCTKSAAPETVTRHLTKNELSECGKDSETVRKPLIPGVPKP